ncbi:MFS polyamine transporter [Panaeolus papilionaceus]|nr:MFS polyamine transporter [Panaeolus papilionaceus]
MDRSYELSKSPLSTLPSSVNSSVTYLEPISPAEPSNLSEKKTVTISGNGSPLEEIVSSGEEAIERYGGDDIHEPPSKAPAPAASGFSPAPTIDANMVTWDGPNDPANPQNWSIPYKWLITALCIIMTVNVTFASSAPSSASRAIAHEFKSSDEVSYLITTVFLLGYVFGPLFWGPGSELIGRRPIFIVTLSFYTLFHLGQALAQNMETLLITRFLGGFFAVAPLTNCGGVIADIWPAIGRGPATSLFTASVFLGPVLGPIVSGFIVQDGVSWRWVFWVMMIFAGVCTLIVIPLIPETYAPVLLLQKAQRLRKEDPIATKDLYAEHEKQDWSFKGVVHRTLFRPFSMLAQEPILVLITIYLSVVYGLLYARKFFFPNHSIFQAFPVVFIVRRGMTMGEDGLMFIGVGIGTTLGSLLNVYATAHYPELIKKWKGFPPPEQRLFGAMIGSPILVVGIFWLGWTGEYASVPWYVPGLSTIVIGLGISTIFMSFLSYLVDTYLMYAASAFAANTIIRSAVAAAFPLFTTQMFTKMHVNWACTLIGLVALLFVPSPFLFYKYGARIRTRSKFAPCIDLRIAELLEAEENKQREKEQLSP